MIHNQHEGLRHTMVEVIPAEESLGGGGGPDFVPQPPPHQWGSGRPLDGEGTSAAHAAKPLSADGEALVRHRLAQMIASGREKKIQKLFACINGATVAPEVKAQLKEWISQFAQLDQQHGQERSLSLGILVCKVIRPTLAKSTHHEEQEVLFALDTAICEILQQMWTNGEKVENFLQENEIGLLLEKVFRESCERIDAAAQAVIHAEEVAGKKVDDQIEQSCNRMKERFLTFQNTRRERYTVLHAQVTALTLEVDQLRQRLLDHVAEIKKLGEADMQVSQHLDANLAECEQLLGRLA